LKPLWSLSFDLCILGLKSSNSRSQTVVSCRFKMFELWVPGSSDLEYTKPSFSPLPWYPYGSSPGVPTRTSDQNAVKLRHRGQLPTRESQDSEQDWWKAWPPASRVPESREQGGAWLKTENSISSDSYCQVRLIFTRSTLLKLLKWSSYCKWNDMMLQPFQPASTQNGPLRKFNQHWIRWVTGYESTQLQHVVLYWNQTKMNPNMLQESMAAMTDLWKSHLKLGIMANMHLAHWTFPHVASHIILPDLVSFINMCLTPLCLLEQSLMNTKTLKTSKQIKQKMTIGIKRHIFLGV
jgi:hypothetical protein